MLNFHSSQSNPILADLSYEGKHFPRKLVDIDDVHYIALLHRRPLWWSRDGVTWSEPRVGAFNTTVNFTDGTSMTCQRRERPQMLLDDQGIPLVMFSGTTGCPRIEGTPYKGIVAIASRSRRS